jgi:hypothetical protein
LQIKINIRDIQAITDKNKENPTTDKEKRTKNKTDKERCTKKGE